MADDIVKLQPTTIFSYSVSNEHYPPARYSANIYLDQLASSMSAYSKLGSNAKKVAQRFQEAGRAYQHALLDNYNMEAYDILAGKTQPFERAGE